MKEYECVQIDHHKKIAAKIQEYIAKGWRLHTYQAAGLGGGIFGFDSSKHYLLFEKG